MKQDYPIQVGDIVRSYDFADAYKDDDGNTVIFGRDVTGERACYVEGVVTAIQQGSYGMKQYAIEVKRDVFGGKEMDRRVGETVYPPINGTPKMCGGTTDYVEVIF